MARFRKRDVLRPYYKKVSRLAKRVYKRARPIVRRLVPSYVPLPRKRGNKYLINLSGKGSPMKTRTMRNMELTDWLKSGKAKAGPSTDIVVYKPRAGINIPFIPPTERSKVAVGRGPTADVGISAPSFKASKWLKYKPFSPITTDWSSMKQLAQYKVQLLRSSELFASAGKQVTATDTYFSLFDFRAMLKRNSNFYNSTTNTWLTEPAAAYNRLLVNDHYVWMTLTNNSNVPVRVRLVLFKCLADSIVPPFSYWADDLGEQNSQAEFTTGLIPPTYSSLTRTTNTLGEFPHSHLSMRNYWKIQTHRNIQLGVGDSFNVAVKLRKGMFFPKDFWDNVANEAAIPDANAANFYMKGITQQMFIQVMSSTLGSVSTTTTNVVGKDDYTPATLSTRMNEVYKFKFPNTISAAPHASTYSGINLGATPDTTMQFVQATNVNTVNFHGT